MIERRFSRKLLIQKQALLASIYLCIAGQRSCILEKEIENIVLLHASFAK